MNDLQQTPATAELPQLTAVNGHATCLSTDVARHFGKRHDDVLKAIRALLVELPDSHLRNFAEMEIDVEIGLGKVRKSPAYRLTRDGFTLLCMGFTGKRALQFKLAYIDAFNRMEQQLAQASHGQDARAARARFAPRIAYQNEDWFLRLCAWASVVGVSTLAYNLGVSRYTLSKVLHGRDGYGHGHWPHALAQLAQQGLPDQPPPFYPARPRPFAALTHRQCEQLSLI
ncbi:Rha family transcriptional regulator [Vandammella animalimorsus]|uniref:Rha family transcriptional regulator n=1 Tax=Vandammella animalimorsus TaxID=2029117 RepID=A0A2A2AB39_9BURK|nr:Rha family transcriptional regulator [Vandammella animalimorsus]PAT34944.1 hypothetical protein CK625_12555 [Vandammella animalimorsus]